MKFKVTMKDPDTLHDAIGEAVEADLAKIEGLSDDDRDRLYGSRRNAVSEIANQWFRYGEYLTVEIDTEAKTIIVCPAS